MKEKVLIISVGTGTRPDAQKSLATAIIKSINNNNPDHTVFVVTDESLNTTMPLIKEKIDISLKSCEEYRLTDADNVMKIYNELAAVIKKLKVDYRRLAVDFTSGTKAMSGALVMAACLHEADDLCYIAGERQNGIVAMGAEELKFVSPLSVISDKKLAEAVLLFNRHQYDGVIAIVNELEKTTSSRTILDKFTDLKKCAMAYSCWDRFNHREALNCLKSIDKHMFNENKRFLNELEKADEKEPYYEADLINNAKRRAEEGKYDDAVARLYRAIELLSQYSLKKYGFNSTENVSISMMPDEIISKYQLKGDRCNIALDMGWNILAARGDSIAVEYIKDNHLKNALNKRNKSILAHGLQPLGKEDYEKLIEPVLHYAGSKIPELKELMRYSAFGTWPL